MGPLAIPASVAALAGCSPSATERLRPPPLETVAHVDLARYVGTWCEIASFPQSFQRGCVATTATCTIRGDGDIDVRNRCRKDALDGPENPALGRARVEDGATSAKLEVSFFPPFWGDSWIVDLGAGCDDAVVGHPGRDDPWILSGTPTVPEATWEGILERLKARRYGTSRLERTLH